MSRTLQSEDQISHYRVVGPLGAGGMGEVYIAQDEKLERRVALKVLPVELVRNEERVRRFITEAKSASSLNHPNIVTIYEIGHDVVRALTYIDRDQGWNLMRKPLPEGAPVPMTHYKEGQIVDHRWLADGSRLVLHRRTGQPHSLWMLRPGQGEPTMITEFKTGAVPRHEWAPDEALLYLLYTTSSQDVVLISGLR